jgi:carboxymethylenebutenolidase
MEHEGKLSRRALLRAGGTGALAAGFALAVRPISAATIVTPDTGLVAGPISIPRKGGDMPAYRALPTGPGPFPVVLVVHEIFGLHEYVRDVCRRLAGSGVLAVAPDLFYRHGDAAKIADIEEIKTKIVGATSDAEVFSSLDAAIAWARQDGKGDVSRVAITGFCWGGRIVWLYADYNPTLRAGVAWYGRLEGDKTDKTPRYPLDVAESLRVPVLGLYGGADEGIPAESVERMRAALARGKSGSEIIVFPGAPHGFHADYRPSYRADAAESGWKKLLDWLHGHGVG